MQNKATGQNTRISEDGQGVTHMLAPTKESKVREESEKVLKGNGFAILAAESAKVFRREV